LNINNLLDEKTVPKQFYPAIEKGIRESLQVGPNGYPVTDVKITVIGADYHEDCSNELAFIFASSMAVREGIEKASPILLEPFFAVEIVSPEDYVGDVIADFSSRRGKVEGIETQGLMQVVKGTAPLSEMFGYVTHLRSMSQGRAVFSMLFSHYEQALIKNR
jgi:elongation factor G